MQDFKDMKTDKQKLENLKKRYQKQNQHIRDCYDRISVTLPKGYKDIIVNNGDSINGYINRLVTTDLRSRGLLSGSDLSSNNVDDSELPFR